MRKLLIISASSKILKDPLKPVKATERFDGLFMNIVRKYIPRIKNVDVLILSPVYGLILSNEKIPYLEPLEGSWNKAHFSMKLLKRQKNATWNQLKKFCQKENMTRFT